MHLRFSTRRQGDKTYRYAQLVESRRRDDGMPAHRVIANLGALSDQAAANIRTALRATRAGRAVVVSDDSGILAKSFRVQANLRYLDLAVLLELWRSWRLDGLLTELLPEAETAAPAGDVVTALMLQRCVEPGSKLHAQRWLPTTALPELLDLVPARFNNTRLHRVLDQLWEATPKVQDRLAALYEAQGVATSAFFIDVTDTFFEGRGCEMAQRHRTKAGHRHKWSIGIVLLANDRGFPLRWSVVASKTAEHVAMCDLVDEVKDLPWIANLPLVCDRAMGKEGTLSKLLASGVHFLTAAPVHTIESHTTALPHSAFSNLQLKLTDASRQDDLATVVGVARSLGWEELNESTFIHDLGLVGFDHAGAECGPGPYVACGGKTTRGGNAAASQLRYARQLQARWEKGIHRNLAELAKEEGISLTRIRQLLGLLRLPPDVRDEIFATPAGIALSENALRDIVKERDPKTQREMFRKLLASKSRGMAARARTSSSTVPDQLRLVAYFNPQMFIEQRRRNRAHLEDIRQFVRELNQELAAARQSRKRDATLRKITRKLERHNYTEAFDVALEPIQLTTLTGAKIASFRCMVEPKPSEWARRHRYNGFVLLLAHPDLPHPARTVVGLFRSKDAVEKDFQTIKSVVKLRPIFHKTDPKVQAHVTICMLSLLLHRILEDRLKQSAMSLSGRASLEILKPCFLNRVRQGPSAPSLYSLTEATTAQREILEALGMNHLTSDAHLANVLHQAFVST